MDCQRWTTDYDEKILEKATLKFAVMSLIADVAKSSGGRYGGRSIGAVGPTGLSTAGSSNLVIHFLRH